MTAEQHYSTHPDHAHASDQPDNSGHKKKSGPLPPPDHGGGSSGSGHGGSSGGGHGGNSGSGTGSGGTTTPPGGSGVPPTPSGSKAFKGIIVFSGDNGSALATDPHNVGKHLNYPASVINPSKGTYRFDLIDADMKPWVDAGKNVIIRVSWCGWKNWVTPPNASWCPDWVYAEGVRSMTAADGSKKPAYWDVPYLAALSDFVAAFASHYDGNPHVLTIPIAVGDGSETKPDTHNPINLAAWKAIGYSDTLWWSTIQKIAGIYQQHFTRTPLLFMPDNTFIEGTAGLSEHTVVQYAVSHKIWLQNNGLVPGQVQDAAWQGTTVLAEQRNKSAGATELQQDFDTAIKNGSSYVLVFSQVLENPANAAVLAKYAALAAK